MALLRYTLLRLLLFGVVAALFWIVGLHDPLLLLLAAVFVSGLISLFVLRGPRDEVSTRLSDRLSTIHNRLDRTAEEDAWVDEQQRLQSQDESDGREQDR